MQKLFSAHSLFIIPSITCSISMNRVHSRYMVDNPQQLSTGLFRVLWWDAESEIEIWERKRVRTDANENCSFRYCNHQINDLWSRSGEKNKTEMRTMHYNEFIFGSLAVCFKCHRLITDVRKYDTNWWEHAIRWSHRHIVCIFRLQVINISIYLHFVFVAINFVSFCMRWTSYRLSFTESHRNFPWL